VCGVVPSAAEKLWQGLLAGALLLFTPTVLLFMFEYVAKSFNDASLLGFSMLILLELTLMLLPCALLTEYGSRLLPVAVDVLIAHPHDDEEGYTQSERAHLNNFITYLRTSPVTWHIVGVEITLGTAAKLAWWIVSLFILLLREILKVQFSI